MLTKLSKNFSIEEFIHSDTADKKGIDNTPSTEVEDNIKYLVETLLQPLRNAISYPFHINSGFRCSKLNKAVGGSSTSAHLSGLAADVNLGSVQLNKILFDEVKNHPSQYSFDQCIWESKNNGRTTWVHLGIKRDSKLNRKQVFSIVK